MRNNLRKERESQGKRDKVAKCLEGGMEGGGGRETWRRRKTDRRLMQVLQRERTTLVLGRYGRAGSLVERREVAWTGSSCPQINLTHVTFTYRSDIGTARYF